MRQNRVKRADIRAIMKITTVKTQHQPGTRITKRSLVRISAATCEVRDQLKECYERSEEGSAKRGRALTALLAHERKHECGMKLLRKSQ
jgi:hypothetical protein